MFRAALGLPAVPPRDPDSGLVAAGWTDVGRANFILDNLIAQKKAVPMLVVMPFGHATQFGVAFERLYESVYCGFGIR